MQDSAGWTSTGASRSGARVELPPATNWSVLTSLSRFSVASLRRDRRGKIADSTHVNELPGDVFSSLLRNSITRKRASYLSD